MFRDIFVPPMRGEFKITAKNKEGEVVYEYEDKNVIVNTAKPVTAMALCQCVLTNDPAQGAIWYEHDGDTANDKWSDEYRVDPQVFQIGFLKMGGGFPRKRSLNLGNSEVAAIPSTVLADPTNNRSALFQEVDLGTSTLTTATSWVRYDGPTEQPYHSLSLLYPRKTDIDLVDRDYQWSKKIIRYTYNDNDINAENFTAQFKTYMRFDEGNGPRLDTFGDLINKDDLFYEYREAGLFIGIPAWTFSNVVGDQVDIEYGGSNAARFTQAASASCLANNCASGALNFDARLTDNLKHYRFWDGALGNNAITDWNPSLTWGSMVEYSNAVKDGSNLCFKSGVTSGSNHILKGTMHKGYYMVARKTFPMISKSKDLELTLQWNLVFGSAAPEV